jgi:putative endonuclease
MKEEFIVYVLFSEKTNNFYKGHTNNLSYRFFRHNNGLEKSTKYGAPWKLVYTEKFNLKSDAIKRENELKTGKGRDFIKQFRPGSPPRRTKD